jgi:hypothetical protein
VNVSLGTIADTILYSKELPETLHLTDLFEDENVILHFASQMHLKVLLNLNRKDCVG